jgi:hypothetical protein
VSGATPPSVGRWGVWDRPNRTQAAAKHTAGLSTAWPGKAVGRLNGAEWSGGVSFECRVPLEIEPGVNEAELSHEQAA